MSGKFRSSIITRGRKPQTRGSIARTYHALSFPTGTVCTESWLRSDTQLRLSFWSDALLRIDRQIGRQEVACKTIIDEQSHPVNSTSPVELRGRNSVRTLLRLAHGNTPFAKTFDANRKTTVTRLARRARYSESCSLRSTEACRSNPDVRWV